MTLILADTTTTTKREKIPNLLSLFSTSVAANLRSENNPFFINDDPIEI